MAGSLAATKIITQGLNCGAACDGLITTYFSLYCEEGAPPPKKGGGGGGGPYPPSRTTNRIFTPQQQQFNPEFLFKNPVDADHFNNALGYIVKFKTVINGRVIEKEYGVPRIYGHAIARILRWSQKRKDNIEVLVKNLRTRLADWSSR